MLLPGIFEKLPWYDGVFLIKIYDYLNVKIQSELQLVYTDAIAFEHEQLNVERVIYSSYAHSERMNRHQINQSEFK